MFDQDNVEAVFSKVTGAAALTVSTRRKPSIVLLDKKVPV